MIVDPDFLDHWRTGMVTDALGDPTAPMCILRLWAHCQERKSDTFVMPTRGLKAQCKFQGEAEAFEKALIEAGFIERDGDTIKVCGWAEKNAALFAAWENGNKGGRPKKKTQSEPSENPRVTQGEPIANPNGTHAEPIREEKRREEKNSSSLRSEDARKRAPAAVAAAVLIEAGFSQSQADDFLAHKARLKAPLTDRAWADHQREASKAGWSAVEAAEKVMAKGWKGFEASYVASERPPARAAPAKSFAQMDSEAKAARVYEMTGGLLGRKPTDTIEVIDAFTPKAIR